MQAVLILILLFFSLICVSCMNLSFRLLPWFTLYRIGLQSSLWLRKVLVFVLPLEMILLSQGMENNSLRIGFNKKLFFRGKKLKNNKDEVKLEFSVESL
jgi:hypothetical protein